MRVAAFPAPLPNFNFFVSSQGVPDGVRVAVAAVLRELGKEEALAEDVGAALDRMHPQE